MAKGFDDEGDAALHLHDPYFYRKMIATLQWCGR